MTRSVALSSSSSDDLGKLVLRVLVGLLVLVHGVSKLQNGIGPVLGAVANAGLPSAVAYLVYVGEVLAPLLMIAGFWTRPAALVVAGNMLVAIGLVHRGQIFQLNNTGGWAIELQAMYLFGAFAVVLLGAGRFSVGGAAGRWN
ncbi:DoxX family protein [Piscinibacter gummiphilus]|jgi:putative oxidoreductase|uniref:GntR family transcriptional regulator n=1 Tax=Piscinibacter gummiphilus TaxID=946333 RepID=A0A1W6LCN1_9BURK|nr:DoxX family protein [Piscinibacter gummiphilus]ARN22014.1 GntR family transcriptional regulator [Piscinibacter gummiphilus]ATU66698.1 DoxX family protein [Piscinibacter gummiphilus]GLS94088.1 GntR family transcriptional regulator [Piscinibacter gummiphilus]